MKCKKLLILNEEQDSSSGIMLMEEAMNSKDWPATMKSGLYCNVNKCDEVK